MTKNDAGRGRRADLIVPDELGQPRPIEEQRWRRHHTGRADLRIWPELGIVIADSTSSGCARRRRKAIERRARWAGDSA